MNDSTKVEAKELAGLTLRVFPCRLNDKRPAISDWPNVATSDPGKVAILFAKASNVAIRCGLTDSTAQFFVVDIDIKDGQPGAESWAEFCQANPEVAEAAARTVRAHTPSGGWHLYFTVPEGCNTPTNKRPWPGVDIRGEGGYVLAPPSKLENGDYEWVRDPWEHEVVLAPPALLDALLAEPARSEPPAALSVAAPAISVDFRGGDDSPIEYMRRNFNLYDFLLRQGWQAGRRRGNEEEITRPGKSQREGTSATFHHDSNIVNVHTTDTTHVPAEYSWIGKPTSNGGYTLTGFDGWMIENGYTDPAKAMSAIRKQLMPAREPVSERRTGDSQGSNLRLSDTGSTGQVTPAAMQQPPDDASVEHVPSLAEAIMARIISTADLANLPQPVPVVEGWLFKDSLAWIWGPSGSGKSFVAVDLAMHVGTGLAWHGHTVDRGRVLYMIAEGASGMAKRTDAWYEANGGAETDVMWLPTAVNMYQPDSADALTQVVAQLQPSLIIIDTLARASVGAEENSAKDAGVLIDNMDRLRIASGGACVMMVHHSGKEATLGGRGSSAFKGAMESELQVEGGLTNLILKNTKQKNIEHSPTLQFFGEHQLVSGSVALRRLGAEEVRRTDEVTDLDIYRCLWDIYDGTNPVTSAAWGQVVAETYGISRATFQRRKKKLMADHDHWVDAKTGGKFIPLESF